MKLYRRLFTLMMTSWLAACGAGSAPVVTETMFPSPPPSVTPEPQPVLDPAAVWIAADSPSTAVLVVDPESGEVTRIPIPLNEGQQASDLVSSPDGRFLAYLVWDDDGAVQHGIATWNLREPNARLIAQPLPGYRFISLLITLGGEIVFVQVQNEPLAEAVWRLEIAPAGGGPSELVADRISAPDLLLPRPIDLRAGTLVMAAESTGDDPAARLYALESSSGNLQPISAEDDQVTGSGALSPDGTQVAYIVDGVVRVVNLRTQEAVTVTPPDGGQAISVAWFASNGDMLIDILNTPGDPETQRWVRVQVGGPPPWPASDADPQRARLFTYRPYGEAVIYTLFSAAAGDDASLYRLPRIGEGVVPSAIALEGFSGGSPEIIYVPED